MAGSESKASPTGIVDCSVYVQIENLSANHNDQRYHFLELLNQCTTRNEAEYKKIEDKLNKEMGDKLNKKLQDVLLLKKNQNDPYVSEMLNLKQEKLELKLKKLKEQYETEIKFVSAIRKLYLDKETEVKLLKESRAQVVKSRHDQMGDLNLKIDALKLKVENQKNMVELKLNEQCQEIMQNAYVTLGCVKKDVENLQFQMDRMLDTEPAFSRAPPAKSNKYYKPTQAD